MSDRSGSNPMAGRRAIPALLLTSLLALALSTPAQAEVSNHPFIGALISGLQPQPKPLRPKLEAPCGVAVNTAEGAIYVSDYARRSIIGASLPEFFPENGPCGLANDGNNLYVNYWHGAVVNPATDVIDPDPSFGVAVNPESKDLYVDHRTSIAVYEAPVEPGNPPAMEIGTGGSLIDGYGVAVSAFPATEGDVYVADAGTGTVKVFDPKVSLTAPANEIDGAGTAAGRFVSLVDASLAIDQSNGHLFVVDNVQPGFEHPLAAVSEFNAEGLYRGELEHQIVDGAPTGIAVDESPTPENGEIYVTSGNGSSVVIPPELGPPVPEQGALLAFGPSGPGQTLEVTTSGAGQGSVKSSPAGIACPGACEAELNSGAIVSLSATPAPGSAFGGWSGACSGTGSCQVTLSSAVAVNAEFVPAPASSSAVLGSSAAGASSPPEAPGPGPEAAALRLGRVAAHAGAVFLRASAPVPGTLSATAPEMRPAHAGLSAPGSATLRLRLTRAGRRALAKSKGARLSLRVAISFKPSQGGAPSALSKTVTFRWSGGRKR